LLVKAGKTMSIMISFIVFYPVFIGLLTVNQQKSL